MGMFFFGLGVDTRGRATLFIKLSVDEQRTIVERGKR
jgi:hypothetical protein